ncbi:MAG: hypothetical protein II969_04565 [Anaerolineaceae bacterium]|nr:hypothetical protein [Anaerolineaceae bacterium]
MNFTDSIRNIVKRLFGIDPIVSQNETNILEEQNRRYKNLHGVNLTAIFAGKLSALTVTESSVEVVGDNQRAQSLNNSIQAIWGKVRKWTSIAYGTGGVLLIPYVSGGKLFTDIVPQSSMVINRINGDEILAVSILADTSVHNDERFFRWTDYSMDKTGTVTIRQRATNATGGPVAFDRFPEWADIQEEMAITGCEHLPLAYIKCPIDNRRNEALYGVPITYGCDDLMKEIEECLEDIRREYKLKKPIVGMDETLFDIKNNRRNLPVTGLFMPTTPGGLDGASKLWRVYDPAIRDSSYYNRLVNLYELLEKQVGTSKGILTEQTSRGATATEIKAGLYDTYSIVQLMREAIAQGIDRLAYAMNVLNNYYSLSPMGEFEVAFDWSYAMIESSQETFNQLTTALQMDAIETAELRNYVIAGETLDEARERVAEIQQAKAEAQQAADLLLQQQLALEAQRG